MRKFILTAISALAITGAVAGTANANVAVDNGVGTIGKGDVQTALGYGNGNDTAFQADAAAGKITFSYGSDVTTMIADIKCSALNIMGPDDPFDTAHNVVSTTTTPNAINVKAETNKGGKVTGYTATGITPGAPTTDSSMFGNWSKCPAGEHFMGWLNGPANAFHWDTASGSGLTVSNGSKTVALPNTPVAAPVA